MRHSKSTGRNPELREWTDRYRDSNNLRFFGDALADFSKKKIGNGGMMVIGLLGQRDIPGHTLRVAQSILRWDQRPSLWSHVFLIEDKVTLRSTEVGRVKVCEAPLFSRSGQFPHPEHNGVGSVELKNYDNPKVDANAALLAIQMSDSDAKRVKQRANEPNHDRLRYNLWESLGIWQGYLWSQGARPNPLREGVPIIASSYAEMAYEAIELDLTPGASIRNSAPEHIWNAAVWWHDTFARQKHPISGYYVLRDKGGSLVSTDD